MPDTTPVQLEAVLDAAAAAAPQFAATTPQDRAGLLRAVADALEDAGDELIALAGDRRVDGEQGLT